MKLKTHLKIQPIISPCKIFFEQSSKHSISVIPFIAVIVTGTVYTGASNTVVAPRPRRRIAVLRRDSKLTKASIFSIQF